MLKVIDAKLSSVLCQAHRITKLVGARRDKSKKLHFRKQIKVEFYVYDVTLRFM